MILQQCLWEVHTSGSFDDRSVWTICIAICRLTESIHFMLGGPTFRNVLALLGRWFTWVDDFVFQEFELMTGISTRDCHSIGSLYSFNGASEFLRFSIEGLHEFHFAPSRSGSLNGQPSS